MKRFENSLRWLRENPYTEKIVSIFPITEIEPEVKKISLYQGDYPVDVEFTATKKLDVTYINKYFGEKTCTIFYGDDAIERKYCTTSLYTGKVIKDFGLYSLIDEKFIGGYTSF